MPRVSFSRVILTMSLWVGLIAHAGAQSSPPSLRSVAGFRLDQGVSNAARACTRAGYRTGVTTNALRCEGWAQAEDESWPRPLSTTVSFCEIRPCQVTLVWEPELQANLVFDDIEGDVSAVLTSRYGESIDADADLAGPDFRAGSRAWNTRAGWVVVLARRPNGGVFLSFVASNQSVVRNTEAWTWTDPPSRTPAPTQVGGVGLSWDIERYGRACREAGLHFVEGDDAATCVGTIQHYVIGPATRMIIARDSRRRPVRVMVFWEAATLTVPVQEAARALADELAARFGQPSVAVAGMTQWRAGSWGVTLDEYDSQLVLDFQPRSAS